MRIFLSFKIFCIKFDEVKMISGCEPQELLLLEFLVDKVNVAVVKPEYNDQTLESQTCVEFRVRFQGIHFHRYSYLLRWKKISC